MALIFMAVGIALLAVAFYFNVNPVDGGAVRGGLAQHDWLFFPLAAATLPAMFGGMLFAGILGIGGDFPIGYYSASFACQMFLYLGIGLAISACIKFLRRT